jgi:hypothetical protein
MWLEGGGSDALKRRSAVETVEEDELRAISVQKAALDKEYNTKKHSSF